MKQTQKATIFVGALGLDVEYVFYPGRPGVHTMPNGDPGYPDEPAEIEFTKITDAETGEDLLELYTSNDFNPQDALYEAVWEVEQSKNYERDTERAEARREDAAIDELYKLG